MGAKCCRADASTIDGAPGDAVHDQWKPSAPWAAEEDTEPTEPTVKRDLPYGSSASPPCPTTGEAPGRSPAPALRTPNSGKRRFSATSSIGFASSERTHSFEEDVDFAEDANFQRARSEGNIPMRQDQSRRTSVSSRGGRRSCLGAFAALAPDGPRSEPALPAEICCLAWSLKPDDILRVEDSELLGFYDNMFSCIDMFGLEVLAEDATRGLLRGMPFPAGKLVAEDAALRVGQLICRQAASAQIGLRVGVHSGPVRQVAMPGSDGKLAYFGEACMFATQLADTARMWTVHISGLSKARLSAFRHVQMTISPDRNSYFLNPVTPVGNYFGAAQPASCPRNPSRKSMAQSTLSTGLGQMWQQRGVPEGYDRGPSSIITSSCTLQEFEEILLNHNVDIDSFGKGSASSLQELHEAVVVARKNDLILGEMDQLVRIVNLVRISLRIRDGENKLRELRLVSESLGDGSRGGSHMPLAITLSLPETNRWREAVENCFEQKLGLPVKTQRAHFQVNMDSYRYMEECSKSERFPGVLTRYKSHNIVINIKDKHAEGLKGIGLPNAESFTYQPPDGVPKNWTWALVGDTKEDELMSLLQAYGIDASELTPMRSRSSTTRCTEDSCRCSTRTTGSWFGP